MTARPSTSPALPSTDAAPTGARERGAHGTSAPYYLPHGNEVEVFRTCHEQGLPVMLKGPTGCGKTRFVEHMAHLVGRPLITVACHDDLSASDLTGRFLIQGSDTVWTDGPLTAAVRAGAICYLDEVVEARQDTLVVIHPLADDRRFLPLEKTGEGLVAAPGFQLVISYNPGYQHALKELKPSTRQRFVALEFSAPPPAREAEIVAHESGLAIRGARALVDLAVQVRRLRDQGLAEGPGTRVLVSTARLMARGVAPRDACRSALAAPLTDDADLLSAIDDLIAQTF